MRTLSRIRTSGWSLRSAIAVVSVLSAIFALLVASALIGFTTLLHHAATNIASSVESVRLAEEAEINLLLHERARDPLVKRGIEADLRSNISEAAKYVVTQGESRVHKETAQLVHAYLLSAKDASRPPNDLWLQREAAYGALEDLVAINIAQSKTAERYVALWDRRANNLGLAVGVLVILIAGGALLWLNRLALAPLLGLARTMNSFGLGDHDARATERGATEMRAICRGFNQMAMSIVGQRKAQMAFLGGVAHDLRNPLAALQLSLESVRADQPLPSEDRVRTLLEKLLRNTKRMNRMIGDFLDVARIEAGELEVRPSSHDMAAIVRGVVDLLADSPTDHTIHVHVPNEPVPLWCDSLRIEQVLTNLLGNALKYSPPGTPIDVNLTTDPSSVILSVTDQGPGLSEEDQLLVFEPFRRVVASKESPPGAGLGLSVVRRIVEAHDGRIEIDSALGRGATFRVLLPQRARVSMP